MATDVNLGQPTARPEILLTGLSIYLSNPSTNPSLVNPDFLRYNEIVDPAWTVARPVVIDHGHSRVSYSNGLSFAASVDHVVISQRAPTDPENNTFIPLDLGDIVCVRAATNLLETMSPDSPYDFITIDPVGMLEIDLKETTNLASPLQALAARIPYDEHIPDVQTRVQYNLADKIVTIYTNEVTPEFDEELLRLFVSGEIIPDLEEDISMQVGIIKDILGAWEQDIQLFKELVYQFYSTYTPRER